MTNLAISTVCNRHCAYCFTRDHLGQTADGPTFLGPAEFAARLDLLDRSGIGQARLLGGEPTLHPRLGTLLEMARARGKEVQIFTNGLMSESALADLEEAGCSVLVNVPAPAEAEAGEWRQLRATLHRLGHRAMPGLNIYRANFQPDFLLALIAETGCRPVVRLGLAHPCLSGENRYIRPGQYRGIGARIAAFARAAAVVGVTLQFDCGFVRCMFTEKELATLREAGADVGWRCNPIPDVDVAGRVLHCFPLARLGALPLAPSSDAAALRRAWEERTAPYRQAGVFPACSTCSFKATGECPGGCLAVTIRRFRPASFQVAVPAARLS